MRAILALLLGAVAAVVAQPPLLVENGAICENKATGFFVMDNTALNAVDSIVYKDTSEDDCLKTCTQNRDQFGRSILCASFVYDHASFSCTVYKDKGAPEGNATAKTEVGKRYFEKVCLNDNVPVDCADAQFIRVDSSVLVGYAVQVAVTNTLEECVGACSANSTCKSAMYFYKDNECILNSESAITQPSGFQKEDDNVIYFNNGCLLKKSKPEETTVAPAVSEEEHEGSSSREETTTQTTTEEPTTISAEVSTDKASHEPSEENPEEDLEEEQEEYDDEKSLQEEEAELEKERRKVEKLAEKAGYTKFKGHPRNFASKTLNSKGTKVELSAATEEEEPVNEETVETEVEELSHGENNEPVEEETKPSKKKVKKPKHKKVNPVSEEVEETPEEEPETYQNYFSDWSDWSPCTRTGERQIRRRKCLDLRRCLGALNQFRTCTEEEVTTTSGPIESVRSLVAPQPVDYDDVEVRPPVPVVRQHPSSLPTSEQTAVWSPWLGTCQQFASGQPCNEGKMIGFESRECIAKDPAYCDGPFFRYCTMPC